MHAATAKLKMDLDQEGKELVKELGAAINSAVEKSPRVLAAIENMREAGYVMDLTIRLEIALRKNPFEEEHFNGNNDVRLNLTAEDLKTLRQMGIRIDDDM
jgi:hypothetical protein